MTSVSTTGSVDRSPSPDPSESAAPIAPDRVDAAHAEPPAARVVQRRIARAKRLRRILAHRARTKPPASEVDVFFSSLFPKQ